MRHFRTLLAVTVAAAALMISTAPAAAEPGEENAAVERDVYVPYDKLWEVFEQKGRGVFLPYEEFAELLRLADQSRRKPVDPDSPVSALVSEVKGEARVSADVLSATATLRIEVLKKGWHEIPIGLGDVAVTSAVLDGEAARLIKKNGGYVLLLDNVDGKEKRVELSLEFAKAYAKAPGRNSVTFKPPLAPISRWEFIIPEPDVKVDIRPLLAATEAPSGGNDKETRLLAFVGATPDLRLEWTPKAEGARDLDALVKVQSEQEIWIAEGVVRTRAKLDYEISRAEVSGLGVKVPKGHKVVNVFDQNVREWTVTEADGVQDVSAALFEPVQGHQSLVIELERFSDDATVSVPAIEAVGATRQQGTVVVSIGEGLRAEPAFREGVLQLDAEELPAHLARGKWQFSYSYAALPFGLQFSVEKIEPSILVDSLVVARLSPEELVIGLRTIFDVQKAGVFGLEFVVPDGFEVRSVNGAADLRAVAAQVDRHYVEDMEGPWQKLSVNLRKKASGRVSVAVDLRRPLEEAALLEPSDKEAVIDVPVPRAAGDHIEREEGSLLLYAPESLHVNVAQSAGLRPVSHAEGKRGRQVADTGKGGRPVVSFAFGAEDVALQMTGRRRAPHATVGQLLVMRVESGVAEYKASLFYDVLYSGVKSFRLDVPASLAGDIRITSPGIRHSPMDGDIADLAEGYVAWRLEGESEFIGQARVDLRWEQKIDQLATGESITLQIPRLVPGGVNRAWGQVVLAKAETIDVTPGDSRLGLRPIDPRQDLMRGVHIKDAAGAFEFHDDWKFSVKATRYQPKEVKTTSIERGLLRMVLTRGDVTGVQAIYRMRSVRQRLEVELPEGVEFDTQPLRINGETVSLEEGSNGRYFVPLVGQQQDRPFVLDLRYVVKDSGSKLVCPAFPEEPAAQKLYLSVFLPSDYVYLGSRGPWTGEFVWEVRGFGVAPAADKSKTSPWLLSWVSQGVNVSQESLGTFATDGRRILFSTLRPDGGVKDALKLALMRRTLFRIFVVLVILAIGGALLPACASRRILVAGAGLIVFVLFAVFAPSFARALVDNVTVAAGFIVLVAWLVRFFVMDVPRRAAARAEKRAARNATPPVPPAVVKTKDDGGGHEKEDAAAGTGSESDKGGGDRD